MYTNKDALRGAIKEAEACLKTARRECMERLGHFDFKGAKVAAFNAGVYQERLAQLKQEANQI